ncbi:SCO6745 family protein [Ilumatobacter sp.]|uniref:SCO6745 family protein n=1 Tax=Ilumatobacter sp. TaxID=1967498 RepID=UPI003B51F98C
MDPRETLSAIAAPTGDIGASFYFDPATVAAGREIGLDGFKFYILGRGGALGDVPAAVVTSAFGYFEPNLIQAQWDKARAIVDPATAAQAYFDECGRRGSERFADLDGLDAYVDAADEVIAHADLAGRPLFAGISTLRCATDDPAACAAQKAAVLRELRGSAHLVAVLASGLTDAQAHSIKRPDDVALFGWSEPPSLPSDADERMASAEEVTDTMLVGAFATLDDVRADALISGTRSMHARLGDGASG